MGCDGGTIPTRDELVRLKKKPEQKDKYADLAAKWQNCAISQEPLRKPIVACELGKLYKKDIVIELLLDRSKFECAPSFDHIRGLKDVKELKLTHNPAYKPETHKGAAYSQKQSAEYICPITGLEMNGRHRFCYLWLCGCVFAERALKEVKADTCHQCGKPCTSDDVVILNGTEEEQEKQRDVMNEKRLKAKLEKKAKKGQRKAEEALGSSDGPSKKVAKMTDEPTTSSKLSNGSSKLVGNGLSSKGKSSKLANGAKSSEGKSEGKKSFKTVQEDPSASKAYKSLFTTHEKAKNQQKAHWVTYNPCFY